MNTSAIPTQLSEHDHRRLRGARCCPHINPRLTRQIETEHRNPPIPFRDMDWVATFEGYEPGDSIGTGSTEQEAIDWLIAEEAHAIATAHEQARQKVRDGAADDAAKRRRDQERFMGGIR